MEKIMEKIMENIIWLSDRVDPLLCKELSGRFQTHSDWSEGLIEMNLSPEGTLRGCFTVGEQSLGLLGGVGKSGLVFGFLLEPVGGVPVALFRIKINEETLSLELDVPEFGELLDYCTPEQLRLERITYTPSDTVTSLAP